MPDMGIEQAVQRAEDMRLKIEALQLEHAGHELGPIRASFGVATAPDHCAFSKLLRTADAALLRAKEGGRNRVMRAETRQSGPLGSAWRRSELIGRA
jgi:diguanylate cyclase (GGDEF)-like protein